MLTLSIFPGKIIATIFSNELVKLNHVIVYALEWNQKSFMVMMILFVVVVSTFTQCLLCTCPLS